MAISRRFKALALALTALLLAGAAAAGPAHASDTTTVQLTVTNWPEWAAEATLYEAPTTWVSTGYLKRLSAGKVDTDSNVVTFTNVPVGRKVFVGIESDYSTLVEDYYIGATAGFAYPLVGSVETGPSTLDLGTIAIPASGSIRVDFNGARVDHSAIHLANENGRVLDHRSLGEGSGATLSIDNLVPGRYRIKHILTADRLASLSGVVTVRSGEEATITWVPPAASRITGKVTTIAGKPLNSVKVVAYRGGEVAASDTTAGKGTYTLVGLPRGDYTLRFITPEFGGSAKFQDKKVKVKGVKAGATTKAATVKLAQGGTITGKVKFSGVSALLFVVGPDGYGYSTPIWNSSKKYTVKGLKSGTYTVYLVDRKTKAKYGTTTVKVKAAKKSTAKTISASKATVTLSGTITGGAYSYVEVRRKGVTSIDHGQGWYGVGESLLDTSVGIGGNAYGSAKAKYKIPGLIPGTYSVGYCADFLIGCSVKSASVKKSGAKNFAARKHSTVTFEYAGATITYSQLNPIYGTDPAGAIKVFWEPSYAGAKVSLDSDAFGTTTPFYFKLNKPTVQTLADVKALAVTGIGGQ